MLTDEQLIERLIEGDTTSLDELYSRYAKKLYVFIGYSMWKKRKKNESLIRLLDEWESLEQKQTIDAAVFKFSFIHK